MVPCKGLNIPIAWAPSWIQVDHGARSEIHKPSAKPVESAQFECTLARSRVSAWLTRAGSESRLPKHGRSLSRGGRAAQRTARGLRAAALYRFGREIQISSLARNPPEAIPLIKYALRPKMRPATRVQAWKPSTGSGPVSPHRQVPSRRWKGERQLLP